MINNLFGTGASSNNNSPLGGLLGQFMPPSPNDIMKTVVTIVLCVAGVGLILGVVYLVTRKGKGARNG